ncbi:hypothetical protein S40285_10448 [Stachybotrys chlorohalonatus IBT 40285]|uniref:Uncharacterized protein n=1 Tax=Stachybotrys chlorohalonatus (strain IBT 40285) TaxID=1283841 RepID=A0A084QGB7_STAC4|nr:hypothetical protein S40285_10448 [Stachybotrys chlorohalonata IBT 40285]
MDAAASGQPAVYTPLAGRHLPVHDNPVQPIPIPAGFEEGPFAAPVKGRYEYSIAGWGCTHSGARSSIGAVASLDLPMV